MNKQASKPTERSNAYLNGVLTVIAGLLGLLLAQGTIGLPRMPEAQAQRDRGAASEPGPQGLVNPADDRKAMITELRRINERLDKIVTAFGGKPIDVAVVSMPKGAGGGGGGGGNPGGGD